MFNPNNFNGSQESEYGYNGNGTEKTRDDYYAENPQIQDSSYEKVYAQAQQEEDDEIRDLYPGEYEPRSAHEALRDAKRLMEEMNKKLDEIEAELKKSTTVDARTITEPTNMPTTVNAKQLGTKDSAGELLYGDDKGNVFSDREAYIESKQA